jgi:hypothetical protein
MDRSLPPPLAALAAAAVGRLATAPPAAALVVNPDISVIGQPFTRWTDDAADPSRKRLTLDAGEFEVFFDAALNPYARGTVTLSIGEEGLELEEGYFHMTRGLPWRLALKGGQYRLGFGKLNPEHPHTYPFAERWRVLGYLPGEEGFTDVAVQLSTLVALPGDAALTLSADWLQGDEFRLQRGTSGAANDPLGPAGDTPEGDRAEESRPGVLGRASLFLPIGERSGLELGASGTTGTNNVAAGTRTTVLGADAKLKLWTAPSAYLLVQGELLQRRDQWAGWDEAAASYTSSELAPSGGYLYADYNFATRYNVGAGWESYQQPAPGAVWDQAFKVFAGFSLLEETTAFRLDWDHLRPGRADDATADPGAVNTLTLRVIFSMGPHKAHQF